MYRQARTALVPVVLGVLLVLLALPDVAGAAPTDYEFVPIMSTNDTSVICVGMNNVGSVLVVMARSTPGTIGAELWRGDGGTPIPLASRLHYLCPSINDSGEVAYATANEANINLLVRDSNGTLTILASHDQLPFFAWGKTVPSISSNGSVLFQGNGLCSAVGENIYVTPPLVTIYNCLDFTLDVLLATTMNDNLVVAFTGRSIPDGNVGVYRGSSATALVSQGAEHGSAVINNAGTVAYIGTRNGEYAVYTTVDGVTFSRLSPINNPGVGRPISINDSGKVAYTALDVNGFGGIYVGPNLDLDRVIGVGDELDGSVVESVRFLSNEGFNNGGQVAFYAKLTDGREWVYRADPRDTQPPTVTAPAPISVTATEPTGARGTTSAALSTFLGAGSALDNADPSPVRLQPQVNGIGVGDATLFPLGSTTVTFRFQDAARNIGTATSTVDVTAPVSCAADVTASALFADGKTQLNKRTGNYVLRVRMTIANDGPTSITGPVSFVFDDLTPGVVLVSQQGQTQCASPLGSPYVGVNVGADNLWSRKERVIVDLEFSSPSPSISFTRRILAGAGQR